MEIYQALINLKGIGIKKFLWKDKRKYLISKKTLEDAQSKGKCNIISIGKELNCNIEHYSKVLFN